MILLYIFLLLFAGYGLLIIYYWMAWRSAPVYIPLNKVADIKISVIIAARNEEDNIASLLDALEKQSYQKKHLEIIVVDDHSTDNTISGIKKFAAVRLIELKEDVANSYKKKAIEKGIAAATGDFIITTDADCIPGPEWIQTFAFFIQERKAVFVAAPVVFTNSNSPLQIFQALDFMVLQGITGASVYKGAHSMCNGANMGYAKQAFHDVNGFSGIDNIASGDDMLLMHKIASKNPGGVYYLKSKEATMMTQPMTNWKKFFNQRIRWASKAKFYDDKRIFAVLILVYLFNLSFLALMIVSVWCPYYWLWLGGFLLAKTIVEFPFIFSISKFFNKTSLLKYFLFFQPLHIFYTIFSGILGQFGKYEWKGRKVK